MSKAFKEGQDAFYAGHEITHNPYPCQSDEFDEWFEGFECAECDADEME